MLISLIFTEPDSHETYQNISVGQTHSTRCTDGKPTCSNPHVPSRDDVDEQEYDYADPSKGLVPPKSPYDAPLYADTNTAMSPSRDSDLGDDVSDTSKLDNDTTYEHPGMEPKAESCQSDNNNRGDSVYMVVETAKQWD